MSHTIDRIRVDETPSPTPQPPTRRSRRTLLGWAAILVGLATAVTLVLLALTSDGTPPRTENEQPPAEQSLVGVPRSADGAERWLAHDPAQAPIGVPRSADAAERWLAGSHR